MRNLSSPTRCDAHLRFFWGARASRGVASPSGARERLRGPMRSMALLAVLATASPSFAQQAPGSSANKMESSDASARFANAQGLFKAEQFAEALPIFRDLAETTQSPNARLYVGHCLQRLGKNVDAYAAFAAVVKEINEHPEPRYVPTREAAIKQLAVLNVRLARIVVSPTDIPPAANITLDGKAIDQKDLGSSILVEPGSHRVEVSATGGAPMRREVSIDGGELKTVTFSSKKVDEDLAAGAPTKASAPAAPSDIAADDGASMRTAGLVVGGAGLAGLAVFTVTGLMLKTTVDDLEAQCPNGCSDADHLGQIDRAKALQTTANVGLGVGLVGIGAGTMLFVLGRRRQGDNPMSVSVSNGGATISYAGRF
jgi:hypothetical protein